MYPYPTAYTEQNLAQILDANTAAPNFASDELSRLLELARQRRDARGSFDSHETECLICTDWTGYASDEFGDDDGELNQTALGVYDHDASSSRQASLFTDTVVVQQQYLETGDGRRTKLVAYVDDDYEAAKAGELWVPDAAADYLCIVALSPELHDD